MARRRYQRGHVFLRGKRGQRVWVGRYLEGITPAGKRINKSVVLGEGKDFSGKKMALRALEPYLKKVNDINYRPATPVTFEEFAKTWKDTVLPTVRKRSYRRDIASSISVLAVLKLRAVPALNTSSIVSTSSPKRWPATIASSAAASPAADT